MINTILFKISTHIFTRRMTATCTNTTVSNIISTHILTKRMTASVLFIGSGLNISTHILTKRMTKISKETVQWMIFQLTSSRRGWPISLARLRHPFSHFNSHPHEEDDEIDAQITNVTVTFQLTSSRRGWPSPPCHLPTRRYFNSHPHEEDDVVKRNVVKSHIFQLTSSRRGWRA